MKKYEKPLAELIVFQTVEAIMDVDIDDDVDLSFEVPDEW